MTVPGVAQNSTKPDKRNDDDGRNLHCLGQTLLVHGHLDCHMWQVFIEQLVRGRGDSRVVLGVFVELRDRPESVRRQ